VEARALPNPDGRNQTTSDYVHPFLKLVRQRVRANGGWVVVLDRIANGETLTSIAKSYDCSRHTMYKLLHDTPELWDLFLLARRDSAMALGEEATAIVDALAEPRTDSVGTPVPVTSADVALVRVRAEQRRWLAAAYDRDVFGVQQPANAAPTISIGQLHLRVLMAPPTQPAGIVGSGASFLKLSPAEADVEVEVTEERTEP